MNLKGIRLEDTDLSGGVFIRANLEGSRMRRVKLTSATFTNANLRNIDWADIETKEVQLYKGHSETVNSIAFSPSGELLASGRIA